MTQTTAEVDEELADELFEFSLAADGETVAGEITSIEKYGSDEILVTVRLPTGQTFTERFDYPNGDTSDYKFVRLARQCGFSLGSVEHLAGCTTDCRYSEDDGWEIIADQSASHRARQTAETALATLATPLWLPWGLYRAMKDDRMVEDAFDYAIISALALMVWASAILLVLIPVAGVV